MQNIDSHTSVQTDEDTVDLPKAPTSLYSIPDSAALQLEAGIQSDPESRPKVKARSRFTSAFRRLSRSTRKKEEPSSSALLDTAIVSSGGEDSSPTASGKLKKKSTLSRRFLIGSLKKSKSSSKKSTDESEGATIESTSQEIVTAEDQGEKVEVQQQEDSSITAPPQCEQPTGTETGSAESSPRIRRVQITISGKKVEPLPLITPTKESAGALTEPDYLTPTEETPEKERSHSPPSTSPTSDSDPAKGKKKKLKVKKTVSTTTASSSNTPTGTATSKTTTKTEEKFVITQSARDTPPREKAPAKPSRVAVSTTTTSQTTTSSGAIRKPTARVAGSTLTSPSPATGTAKRHRSLATALTVAGTVTKFMHGPQGTLQRGHRLPKPTTIGTAAPAATRAHPPPATTTTRAPITIPPTKPTTTTTTTSAKVERIGDGDGAAVASSPASSATSPPALAATELIALNVDDHHHKQQIQFQLESHASNSTRPAPTPTAEEQPQSLPPPTDPPPPVPADAVPTSEIRSPAHLHPSLGTAAALIEPERGSQQRYADESVAADSHSAADEAVVSSAESTQPDEFSGDNIRHSNGLALQRQPSQDTLTRDNKTSGKDHTSSDPPAVWFAVGRAVRPPGVVLPIDALRNEPSSFDSNKSSRSISPISESSRRRIQYVEQATLQDEFNSLERRRSAFRYQTDGAEYSLDSESDESESNREMPAFGDLTMDEEMEPTIMTSSSTEKREHLYKILVIGELGTGKTSFIKRYVHQFFSQNYRATIGVDFALKVLHWDSNTIVRLQLWDIAGQERFGNMTRVYYKEAVGAFIVFDVTRSGTFDCVSKWKEDLDSKVQLPDGSPIPCILLANKCDQEKQGIVATPEKIDEYVRENGFAGWFETSAKENINIDEAARALVNKILLNDKLISAADLADSEKLNLSNSADQSAAEAKSKCSC